MRLSLPWILPRIAALLILGIIGIAMITHAQAGSQWYPIYFKMDLTPQFQGWNFTIPPSRYDYRYLWFNWSGQFQQYQFCGGEDSLFGSTVLYYGGIACLTYTPPYTVTIGPVQPIPIEGGTNQPVTVTGGGCGSTMYFTFLYNKAPPLGSYYPPFNGQYLVLSGNSQTAQGTDTCSYTNENGLLYYPDKLLADSGYVLSPGSEYNYGPWSEVTLYLWYLEPINNTGGVGWYYLDQYNKPYDYWYANFPASYIPISSSDIEADDVLLGM